MLVLTRKADQRISIGRDVVVTIVRISANSVRVGIDAPADVEIVRTELAGLNDTDSPRVAASQRRRVSLAAEVAA